MAFDLTNVYTEARGRILDQDGPNPHLSDANIDIAARAALARISVDRPNDTVADFSGDGGKYYDLDTVLPLWVMVVVLGRELVVTLFREWAVRREVVIAAGVSGKYKTLVQNLFSGGLLLWYPLQSIARNGGWHSVPWRAFTAVHATWIGLTLSLAIILTVYSMIDYFWSYRALIGVRD